MTCIKNRNQQSAFLQPFKCGKVVLQGFRMEIGLRKGGATLTAKAA